MTHFVSKSDTPVSEKDLWRTPLSLFNSLDNEFDFKLDVCADHDNALCGKFFSIENSALENSWATLGAAFMNPPYSMTKEFLGEAARQASEHGVTVVALVNANTDTKWFADAAKAANEIRLISGRISFVSSSGGAASGNTKGQCIIIWRGKCKSPCLITMVDRSELCK